MFSSSLHKLCLLAIVYTMSKIQYPYFPSLWKWNRQSLFGGAKAKCIPSPVLLYTVICSTAICYTTNHQLFYCIPPSTICYTVNRSLLYCKPSSVQLYTVICSTAYRHLFYCKPSSVILQTIWISVCNIQKNHAASFWIKHILLVFT